MHSTLAVAAIAAFAAEAVAMPAAPVTMMPRQSSTGASYEDIAVYHHNIHRQNHSAGNVTWDDGLANTAQIIAESCVWGHNQTVNGGGYGQNIAAGVQSDNISAIITDLWYNNEMENFADLYGQASPDSSDLDGWGHFTQVVWAGTFAIGCATQDCTSGGLAGVSGDVPPYFTVCNYNLTGNVYPEFDTNVLQPLGEPVAQWNTGIF